MVTILNAAQIGQPVTLVSLSGLEKHNGGMSRIKETHTIDNFFIYIVVNAQLDVSKTPEIVMYDIIPLASIQQYKYTRSSGRFPQHLQIKVSSDNIKLLKAEDILKENAKQLSNAKKIAKAVEKELLL